MPEHFPAELAQFVDQHIKSLAELETLLLLRQHADQTWTPADVAKALYSTPEMCARQLVDLSRRGFFQCVPEETYQYRPTSADLDCLLGELADIYQQRRVAVITLIYSKPVNNVQTFADAFRLRKEG